MKKIFKQIVAKLSGSDYSTFWKCYFKSYSKNGLVANWNKFKVRKIANKNCAYIGVGGVSSFKDIPFLPHGLHGIHIAGGAMIGNNCTIFQNVTIGQSKEKYPIIGDSCTIGANAIIIGDVKVGNNVRIGAGAIVVNDVPDNATVVMNKPRIIIKNSDYKVNEY